MGKVGFEADCDDEKVAGDIEIRDAKDEFDADFFRVVDFALVGAEVFALATIVEGCFATAFAGGDDAIKSDVATTTDGDAGGANVVSEKFEGVDLVLCGEIVLASLLSANRHEDVVELGE